MKLHQLEKSTAKENKRVGRGIGSGKGKTAGRGTKGQKARGKIPQSFIGGTLPLYKKLPLKRGLGNGLAAAKPKVITLEQLSIFKAKTQVDMDALLKEGLISKKDLKSGVKLLGTGEIKTALTVKIPASASAREKIEKAGGKTDSV